MSKYIETKNIPLDQIELTPWHPRKNLEEADLESIGGNIAEKGQMQSIRVVLRDDKYIIAFGGRRVAGSRLKGLKEIRAEIWEMADTELINDQVRELLHTHSLDGSPDWDDFILYAFHHNVEERISLCNLHNQPLCPACYDCEKQRIPKSKEGYCPAFLSQTEFAKEIIGNTDQSSISRAISRAKIRQDIPEIKELEVPTPSTTLPIISGLIRDEVLNKDEAIALATKAANGQLGSLIDEEMKGHRGPVRTLEKIGTELRKKGKDEIPSNIKEKLIYNPNYGPAEAQYEMLPKQKIAKTDEDRFEDIIEMAQKLADKLDKVKRESKLNQMNLSQLALTLRLLADYFNDFAKLAEGGLM